MMKKLREALARSVESGQIGFGKIFVIQLILFFAIYGVMLIPRFSTDSYSVYFYTSDGLNGFLELGRTGTFLLYRILLALGVNSVTLSPLFITPELEHRKSGYVERKRRPYQGNVVRIA